MFTFRDQLATAQILYQLRKESQSLPNNVLAYHYPQKIEKEELVPLVEECKSNPITEKIFKSSFPIPDQQISNCEIGEKQRTESDSSPEPQNLQFLSQKNNKRCIQREEVGSSSIKRRRQVSFTRNDGMCGISENAVPFIPMSQQNSFILGSKGNAAMNFRGLAHPPALPSPDMNLMGVSFPMFYPSAQLMRNLPSLHEHAPLPLNMLCRQISQDVEVRSYERQGNDTQEKPLSSALPKESIEGKKITKTNQTETKTKRKKTSLQQKPKICRMHECTSFAAKNTPYCSQHSGTRICEHDDCNKCAQGRTRFCIRHGGGRRCTFSGCNKGARDHRFCAAHGGGRRCKIENCNKSAVGGTFRCSAHGGGRRCQMDNCDKCAQSGTKFCVKHGGGKRCIIVGCTKVARGKSDSCMSHR